MFGLKAFFSALARLTTNVNESADLFGLANSRLKVLLAVDDGPEPFATLPAPEPEKVERKGRGKSN
jgi:hypothetical protein